MFNRCFRSTGRSREHEMRSWVRSATPRRNRIALCVLSTITLLAGCAGQYHWYRCGCGCVNYNYCLPAPLPYTPYCSCPTPIANTYQRQMSQPTPEPVAPEEASEPTTETLPE